MQQSIRYSQNFLRSEQLVKRLVGLSSISADDLVLDIGAGSGSITRVIAARAGRVSAYEADGRLARDLQLAFIAKPKVRVLQTDFIQTELPRSAYKVFANIPFNRTSDIVHKLLDEGQPPVDCYLIIQRDAAIKFMGATGRMSLFSVLHQPYFEFSVMHEFRGDDFVPRPSVQVVLLRIQLREVALVTADERGPYADFVSYIFNHANPNILPALQRLFPGAGLRKAQELLAENTSAKPSHLSLDHWLALHRLFVETASFREQRLIAGTTRRLTAEAATIEKRHRTTAQISPSGRAQRSRIDSFSKNSRRPL